MLHALGPDRGQQSREDRWITIGDGGAPFFLHQIIAPSTACTLAALFSAQPPLHTVTIDSGSKPRNLSLQGRRTQPPIPTSAG